MKRIITMLMGILLIGLILNAQEAPPQAFSFKATIKDSKGLPVLLRKVSLRISILQGDMNGTAVYSEFFNPITNLYSQVDIEIGRGTVLSGSFSAVDWSADAYYLKIEADVRGGVNYQLLSVTQLLSVPYALFAGRVMNNEDNDADPLNEVINNAYLSGTDLSIQEGGTTNIIDLSGLQDGMEDADADPENEIQVLSLEGNMLTLSTNGAPIQIDLTPYLDNTNQNLSSVIALGNSTGGSNITNLSDPVNPQDAATKNYVDQLLIRIEILENIIDTWNQELDLDGDGFSLNDCNDNDPAIYPMAPEICDGKDNDCNGAVDDKDIDQDGFMDKLCGGNDCNDLNNSIHPGVEEICDDGIDQNCDGGDLECDPLDIDNDSDSYSENEGDCDDVNPNINPGATELCGDGIDQDCDGEDQLCPEDTDDDDGDGYTENQGDCDDSNSQVNPGELEACGDAIDNNCNGFIDEDKLYKPAAKMEGWTELGLGLNLVLTASEPAISDPPCNYYLTYEWDILNDGSYEYSGHEVTITWDNLQPLLHYVKLPYEFPVTLRVTNFDGVSTSSTVDFTLYDYEFVACFIVSQETGYSNEHFSFDATCTDQLNPERHIVEYSWKVRGSSDAFMTGYKGMYSFLGTPYDIVPPATSKKLFIELAVTDDNGTTSTTMKEILLNNDSDNDGYVYTIDCDDHNHEIHPDATEICGDGIDYNCDGVHECPEDTDDDGDGYAEMQGDCNDADAAINPAVSEICGDGIDQDCNGEDEPCGYGQLVYNEVTILPETVTEVNPSIHQMEFYCDLPFNANSMTTIAQMVFEAEDGGGSDLIAKSLAMDILKRYVNSNLLFTSQEIGYTDAAGGKTFDYMVSIYDKRIAVEVARAYKYYDEIISIDECEVLLSEKLTAILLAVNNALPAFKPEKSLLVIFTSLQGNLDNLHTAISNLDPTITADTMILLVLTKGDDAFIYE